MKLPHLGLRSLLIDKSTFRKKNLVVGYPSHIFNDKKGNWETNFIHSLAHLDIHELKKKL